MSARDPLRWVLLTAVAGLVLLTAGCNDLPFRPKEHASAALLDSGKNPKISSRQTADMQVAIGRTHEQEGKAEEAEAAYLAALKRDPKRADAEARLAILSAQKGNNVEADKRFGRALKLSPKDPEILCDQGYSFYLRRRWSDAETSLQKAIALSPSHSRSHNNLGLVLARRGEVKGALDQFAQGGCDPADAHSNLGLVLALEGHLEDASREYKLALAAKPASPVAREGLKAANLALVANQAKARVLAESTPRTDPALTRTSATIPR